MITRLRIKNWKSHADSEFKFSKGVNALLGIMGSGKSSAMDAMCFALFGTFPALNQRKLKLDDTIRSRPEQFKRAEIELDFSGKEGEVYSVHRVVELGKGTVSSDLRKNGELIEGPNSQRTNDRISELLKVDYEVFSKAVFADQNQLDYFLNIPKGQRMARIDRLLRIDRFETARKTASSVVNKCSNELSSKELVTKDIVDAEALEKLVHLEKEKHELENNIRSLREGLEKLSADRTRAKENLAVLEAKRNAVKVFEVKREGLNGQLLEMQSRLEPIRERLVGQTAESIGASIQKTSEQLKQASSRKSQIDEAERVYSNLNSTLEVFSAEMSSSSKKLREAGFGAVSLQDIQTRGISLIQKTQSEQALETRKEEIEKVSGSRNKIKEQLDRLEFKSVEFQKKLEKCDVRRQYYSHITLDLGKGKNCPLCKSALEEKTREELLKEHETNLSNLEQEKTRLNQSIIQVKEKRDELNSIYENLKKIEEALEEESKRKNLNLSLAMSEAKRLGELQAKHKELETNLAAIEKNLARLRTAYSKEDQARLEEELRQLNSLKEGLVIVGKVNSLKSQVSALDMQIGENSVDETVLIKSKEVYESILVKEEKLRSSIDGLHGVLQEKLSRIGELSKKKNLLEQYKKDIQWLNTAISGMEVFKGALKKTQESLRAEFIEIVNEVMTDIWGTLYPYADINAVKLIIEEGDYVLKVHTPSGWYNVEGRASGGERTVACLALRIAFSLALAPNLSWLILDEPTHNLDVNAIDELVKTLRDRLPEMIGQLFLITHEERLESAVSGNLYRLERNKELDEPTRVVSM